MSEQRPSVRIRLRYDLENGTFDLVVDDNAPNMPEEYHDEVARMVADLLSHNPIIQEAGLRHVVWGESEIPLSEFERRTTPRPEEEQLTD